METDKRTRILDAAVETFGRFGYRKASIDDIAAAAGVGKGTVYLVCKNKQDLFYQAVHREIRAWLSEVGQWIDPRKDAEEILLDCALRGQEYLAERPLVRELLLGNYDETLPLWTEELGDLKALGRANTVEILRLGVRQGRFREDLDAEEVAKVLQEIHAAGVVIAYREKQTPFEQAKTARVAVDLILRGLLKR